MTTEFNLSEKICRMKADPWGKLENFREDVVKKEDVKEFIRRLKEELDERRGVEGTKKLIDKLAGDKLKGENK